MCFLPYAESEFAKRFGNPVLRSVPFGPTEPRRGFSTAPPFCDWRKKGLSPVKDQVSVDRERERESCQLLFCKLTSHRTPISVFSASWDFWW